MKQTDAVPVNANASPLERFEALAKGLVGVPKAEVEEIRKEKKDRDDRLHGKPEQQS